LENLSLDDNVKANLIYKIFDVKSLNQYSSPMIFHKNNLIVNAYGIKDKSYETYNNLTSNDKINIHELFQSGNCIPLKRHQNFNYPWAYGLFSRLAYSTFLPIDIDDLNNSDFNLISYLYKQNIIDINRIELFKSSEHSYHIHLRYQNNLKLQNFLYRILDYKVCHQYTMNLISNAYFNIRISKKFNMTESDNYDPICLSIIEKRDNQWFKLIYQKPFYYQEKPKIGDSIFNLRE